jgi:energy-coupling factor transporter ATP-binding protein EcfA2
MVLDELSRLRLLCSDLLAGGKSKLFIQSTHEELRAMESLGISSPVSPGRIRFTVNGAIATSSVARTFMVDISDTVGKICDMVHEGSFVTVCGPRASGKSTLMEHASAALMHQEYITIKVTFDGIYYGDTSVCDFWGALYDNISVYFARRDDQCRWKTAADFVNTFLHRPELATQRVVIFLDEFDRIGQNKPVLNAVLSTLRGVKSMRDRCMIHSVVMLGIYGVQYLNTTDEVGAVTTKSSPFNTTEVFTLPSFGVDGIKQMFRDYCAVREREVDEDVVEDIHHLTGGHAGLVGVCGQALDQECFEEGKTRLNLVHWRRQYRMRGDTWLRSFPTMQKLQNDLKEAKSAALRAYILQYVIGAEIVVRDNLTSRGELYDKAVEMGILRELISPGGRVISGLASFASPVIRQLVISCLVVEKPGTVIPYVNGVVDMGELLVRALSGIPAADIAGAATRMFKKFKGTTVPHQYFYHAHALMYIGGVFPSESWFLSMEAKVEGLNKRCDIVLTKRDHHVEDQDPQQRFVIALMASDDKAAQQAHIDNIVEYGNMFGFSQLWMLHVIATNDGVYTEDHRRARLGQGVNVLVAHHGLDGDWKSFSHAAPNPEDAWKRLA